MKEITIKVPMMDNSIHSLTIKDFVKITGRIFTLRDASAIKLKEELSKKKRLSFNLAKTLIYFCGPSPSPKGKIIGACGPTTTERFEEYFEILLKQGVKGFIGKGSISEQAINLLKKYNAVYFLATGGAGAYLSTFVKAKEVVGHKDLGPEAIFQLDVEDFPTIVGSAKGKTIFQ